MDGRTLRSIDWNQLAPMVPLLRARGLPMEAIVEHLGVGVGTFQRWRKRNKVCLQRLPKSKTQVGEVQPESEKWTARYKLWRADYVRNVQSPARPVTEVPSSLLVGMRLAQLDYVFWSRGWDEFVGSAWDVYEASRAALVGMLAECGT